MKIIVLKVFRDLKEDVKREIGDEFEVTEERFEEIEKGLSKFGEGPWVKVVEEVPAEEVEEPKKPARKTKGTA